MMILGHENASHITDPFVGGIRLSPVYCPRKSPVMRNFNVFVVISPNDRLMKQLMVIGGGGMSPMWRHCNVSMSHMDAEIIIMIFHSIFCI